MCAVTYQELQNPVNPAAIDASELPVIFTNPEFTAIMRDPLVTQGYPVWTNSTSQIWTRPLANGDWLVAMWNQSTNAPASMSCGLTEFPGWARTSSMCGTSSLGQRCNSPGASRQR